MVAIECERGAREVFGDWWEQQQPILKCVGYLTVRDRPNLTAQTGPPTTYASWRSIAKNMNVENATSDIIGIKAELDDAIPPLSAETIQNQLGNSPRIKAEYRIAMMSKVRSDLLQPMV